MQTQDSIKTTPVASPDNGDATLYVPSTAAHYKSVAKVIESLPADATPAQQDSAVQANFKAPEIHYSSRPDTLRLPGQPLGKSSHNISLPLYYKEIYFKSDTLYHPELPGGRQGVAGDPIPYQQSNDDVITSLLLVFAMITTAVVPHSLYFISTRFKNMFSPLKEETINARQTSVEYVLQMFFSLQWFILLSLVFFDYSQKNISSTFTLPTEYHVMGWYLVVISTYSILSNLLKFWVNDTFFERSLSQAYLKFYLFMTALAGLALLPVFVIHVYFGLQVEIVLYYVLLVVILVKMLAFYQSYRIFFEKNTLKLQIFLYFCTLEIIPIIGMWGVLLLVANNLTIR